MKTKEEILDFLELIVKILKFNNENPFKIKSFENAIDIIFSTDEVIVKNMINNRELENIDGIGKGISQTVYDFYFDNKRGIIDKFLENYPETVFDLFKIKGLGPKKISQIVGAFGIKSLDDLLNIVQDNDGTKYQKQLKKVISNNVWNTLVPQIKFLKSSMNKLLYPFALKKIEKLINFLEKSESVVKIDITGELRRYLPVISKLELVVLANSDIEDYLKSFIDDTITKSTKIIFDKSIQYFEFVFDGYLTILYMAKQDDFSETLKLTTPDENFLSKINDIEILDKVIPEMQELENVDKLDRPISSIISNNDIQGILHFHTNWSDGHNSINEMFDVIQDMGFKYAGVCDHSKSSFYANGLNEKRIEEQHNVIDELQKIYKIKLLKGIECDILLDGSLDYSNEILKLFDFLVISVHNFSYDADEKAYTKRIIKAIENPYSNILGHPTGRLLLTRLPYPVDIYKVIDACIENNVIIEINSTPSRMDLDWKYLYYAMDKGAKFIINSDAHATYEIHNIYYGIKAARKVGLPKEMVVNTYDFDNFLASLKK